MLVWPVPRCPWKASLAGMLAAREPLPRWPFQETSAI